jgi:hypothetical protein
MSKIGVKEESFNDLTHDRSKVILQPIQPIRLNRNRYQSNPKGRVGGVNQFLPALSPKESL